MFNQGPDNDDVSYAAFAQAIYTPPVLDDKLQLARPVAFDTDRVIFKEITLLGAFSQAWQAYEQALKILDENRYDLARLKTHDFALEDAATAIRILAGEVPGEEGICLALHPSSRS